jgi:peptide/nickel transport system permease protein
MPELSLPLPKSKGMWKVSAGMQTLSKGLWRLVREKPLGAFGGLLVLALMLCAIFAHWIAPYPYDETNVRNRLQPPSTQFYLGTDNLGRDVFSRIIYGARISVTVGFGAVTLSILLATILGVSSGYFGGKVDVFVQRLVDAAMAFPTLVILLSIMAVLGPGLLNVILVLGIVPSANRSRVIRSARATYGSSSSISSRT